MYKAALKTQQSPPSVLCTLSIGFYILSLNPLTLLSYLGVRILGGKARTEQDSSVSPEDLEALENVGSGQEILEEEEREMISRISTSPIRLRVRL